MKYIIGMDIGGTKCAVILASVTNGIKVVDKIKLPTQAEKGFEQAKDRLFSAAWDILKRNGITINDVPAIGVSCGGPLDSRRGLVLSPPNLPGWDEIPFAKLLTGEFGVPAYLQNDANACALVEWKLGAGKGTRNMIFLTMGTGFGAGIIAEGVLIRGQSDMGGEVGHIRLEDDGPVGFGKAGSVEGFCSGGGIGRLARAMTGRMLDSGHTPSWIKDGASMEDITAKLIGDYAGKGDPDAVEIYKVVGQKLGKALSIFIDAFNPERIVIGSIFVRSESLLRPSMEEVIEKEALIHSRKVCRVVPAATGEQIGDLASIMTACYEMGIDPEPLELLHKDRVMRHYDRLFVRYPALKSIASPLLEAFHEAVRTYRQGGKLLICGNGGSASDSDHIAGELMKGFYKKRPLDGDLTASLGEKGSFLQGALPAIALTQHQALSTAYLNDVDPFMVFAQQVLGFGRRNDLFIGLSTSGNAKNVINAAETAKALGLKTVALTGPDGGRLKDICDIAIKVPGESTADIQEHHLPVYHTLCAMIEEEFFE